jgi:hypothetical protein
MNLERIPVKSLSDVLRGVLAALFTPRAMCKAPDGAFNFLSLAVTLRTTRFSVKKFYAVPTLRLCAFYGSQNKEQLLPYKT